MRGRRPGKDSPFHGFRNLFQLWPYYDPEDWYADIIPDPQVTPLFPQRYLPDEHPAARYLHSSLDSGVIDVTWEPDRIAITLNDYDTWRLASCVEQRLGRKSGGYSLCKPALPVVLTFQGVREAFAFVATSGAQLRLLNHARRSALASLTEFCSTNVFEHCENRLAISIQMYRDASEIVVLCIDSDNLTLEERQRDGWIAAFGKELIDVYDRFAEDRKHRHFVHLGDFNEWLDEGRMFWRPHNASSIDEYH